MNTTTAAREATRRPTQDRVHADRVACIAAMTALKMGASFAQAAAARDEAYAAAMRGER